MKKNSEISDNPTEKNINCSRLGKYKIVRRKIVLLQKNNLISSCLLFEKSPQIAAYVQTGPSEKLFACYGQCSGKLAAGQNGAICMAICLIAEPSPETQNTNLIRALYSCSSSCSAKITIADQVSCATDCLADPLGFYHSPDFRRFTEICGENCENPINGGAGCFMECVLEFTRQNENFSFDKDLLLSPLSQGINIVRFGP